MASTAFGAMPMPGPFAGASCCVASMIIRSLGDAFACRSASLELLLSVVGDGALDRVLCEDRAVDLHRRQVQLFDDLRVLDGLGFVDRLALDPLGRQRRARDGRAAAKGLEPSVLD